MFTATDLPEPVEPAMSRCGIRARSATTMSPSMDLPKMSGKRARLRLKPPASAASRKRMRSRCALGTSKPMTLLPGIGASMRTEPTAIASARSSERLAKRLIFSPGAGSTSKRVTVGPRTEATTRPVRPKLARVSSILRTRACTSLRLTAPGLRRGAGPLLANPSPEAGWGCRRRRE